MIRVIVSEKPSMGRAIAAALGIQGTGRSFIQGKDVIVTWCVGHLVQAIEPEGYNPDLKTWRMDTLPIFPDQFRYAPIEATRDQYAVVASLMNRDDVADVVNATDAGREGELIFDLVYRLSGCAKPVQRFWTSSLTDNAIREAYASMKPGKAYYGLRDAARSRQESDWLVGINCTRAQTLVMRRSGGEGVYSIGRVQTPTLAILVNRELEITDFVPKEFWTVWAVFQAQEGIYRGKWFHKVDGKDQDRFDREEDAKDIVNKLSGLPGKVVSVISKTEKKKPELLYDLTTLQKEANRRFGFTAEHTLEVAQELYEGKLISYPRTNSRYLTEADAQKATGWIKAVAQGQLMDLQPFIGELRKRWPVKLDKRFVNDKEVEDHAALTPTENPAGNLHGDLLKVYELIARRFLAAYFPDRIEGKTTIITKIAKETFKTTGTLVKELGWSAVDPPHGRPKKEKARTKGPADEIEEDEDTGLLPSVVKEETVDTKDIMTRAGKTSPPKRLTEGDLLGAMQSAGRELDDEELKGAMKDCGLGTPATRANIIETLLKRGFVERIRSVLQPTAKGIELIQSIQAETLKSPQMTGEWEARLERIRRGEAKRDEFMGGIRTFVTELVGQIEQQVPQQQRTFGAVVGTCPKCGSNLLLRSWEDRYYVKCAASANPKCHVSFDANAEGKALKFCMFCRGPVRTTRNGGKVCAQCNRWQSSRRKGYAASGRSSAGPSGSLF
ncbi:MAG TPA: DNA topoisomerase 3 [Syntrophales bacterium]|nr:DNA topoisomerase 3 [Syntrophales bacterium]HPL66171.1 DNA topoisomerase 3 [Smithellaceae bacterium]